MRIAQAIGSAAAKSVASVAVGAELGAIGKGVENAATGAPVSQGVGTAAVIGAAASVGAQIVGAGASAMGTAAPSVNNASPVASAAVQITANTAARVAGAVTNGLAKTVDKKEEANHKDSL